MHTVLSAMLTFVAFRVGATNGELAPADMPEPRSGHTSTLLSSGKVLVAGGFGSTGYLQRSALYDPVANRWSFSGELAAVREKHTATLLPNGKVLVTGGTASTASGSLVILNSA